MCGFKEAKGERTLYVSCLARHEKFQVVDSAFCTTALNLDSSRSYNASLSDQGG